MKNLTIKIDEKLDLQLKLYAAHIRTTKAEAAQKALAAGIPNWVMTVPPSEGASQSPQAATQTTNGGHDNG